MPGHLFKEIRYIYVLVYVYMYMYAYMYHVHVHVQARYTYMHMYVHLIIYMYRYILCTCICTCEIISISLPSPFPQDSYLIPYFDHLFEYLHTGSPVYFVIKDGLDYTVEDNQNKICSGSGCNDNSLGNLITIYGRAPDE